VFIADVAAKASPLVSAGWFHNSQQALDNDKTSAQPALKRFFF
jgi:hypothetical protein